MYDFGRAYCLGALILSCLSGPACSAPLYTVTDLGDLPGGADNSTGSSLNESGVVVGRGSAAQDNHAFRWGAGQMTDLGTLPLNSFSRAGAINAVGQIVGESSGATQNAFVWDNVNGMRKLIPRPSANNTRAAAINDAGVIAGWSGTSAINGNFHAVLWSNPTQAPLDLGDLPGGLDSAFAFGINNAGVVVGEGQVATGNRGFIWDSVNGIRSVGGLPVGFDTSSAFAINDAGVVAGSAAVNNPADSHAVLWDSSGNVTDLGDLAGGLEDAAAASINNLGQVVGRGTVAPGSDGDRAFIWDATNGMRDLNTLIDPQSGWILSRAADINDHGQIVGTGLIDGVFHAFLLSPNAVEVPEPIAPTLIALAFAGVAARRRSVPVRTN